MGLHEDDKKKIKKCFVSNRIGRKSYVVFVLTKPCPIC